VAKNQRGYCVSTVREGPNTLVFGPNGSPRVGKGQVALLCPVRPASRQLYFRWELM
jgi:hypothetical protein